MTPGGARVGAGWLGMREVADARARAADLVPALLDGRPAPDGPAVVVDLGSGTASMMRWLAPRLGMHQHWVLVDHDPALLAAAATQPRPLGAHHGALTVETRSLDIAGLTTVELSGAWVVTGSALLDVLTCEEVDALAAICAAAGCAVLLCMTVTGRVDLDPADPLDPYLAAAFNDHQQRTVGGRTLLGPDATATAVRALRAQGLSVQTRPSDWMLGAGDADLVLSWLLGWVAAACEQRPELAPQAPAYLERRRRQADDGRLRVLVGHCDVLALPPARTGPAEPDGPLLHSAGRGVRAPGPGASTASRQATPMRHRVRRWAGLGVVLAVVALVTRQAGSAETAEILRRAVGWPMLVAGSIAVATTVCSAWRWRLVAGALGLDLRLRPAVAAYYRSQLLNAALPGGVAGDVHRAVRHARDSGTGARAARAVWWERTFGQAVQVIAVIPLVLALALERGPGLTGFGGSARRQVLVTGLAGAGLLVAVAWWAHRSGRSSALTRWRRIARAEMTAVRPVLRAWPGVVTASAAVFTGHTATFVLAARVAGSTAPTLRLAQLGAVVIVASALPANLAGWGPREGAAAGLFAMAGLGAATGLAAAVVFGVLALLGVLPGLVVLAADRGWGSAADARRGTRTAAGAPAATVVPDG